jgi:hypothetical protein
VGTFKLSNQGDIELKIKRIRKTCGCSATKLGKKTLKPGESTTLDAEIKANSISGPFSKAIYVESNDPKQRFLRLTLSGKAMPLLKIFPKKYIYMGTLKAGKSYKYSFKLEPTEKNVELKLQVKRANFPLKAELVRKDQHFEVKIETFLQKASPFLDAELEVKVIAPKGWPDVKLKLRGKAVQ